MPPKKEKKSQKPTSEVKQVTIKEEKKMPPPPKTPRKPRTRGPGPAQEYVKCLNDPFNHPGVPLGFGTLVNTKTATAIIRVKLTSGADGSMTIFAFPGADIMGSYQTLGAGVTPVYANYGFLIDAGAPTARANFQSARPIACAIRVTPLTAATDKALRVSAGLIPYTVNGTGSGTDPRVAMLGNTTNAWVGSHMLTNHVLESGGGQGITAYWRPQDVDNFNFTRTMMSFDLAGSTVVTPAEGPTLVVAILGPNATDYCVDIVTRYEALPIATGLFTAESGGAPLSSYFPSIEQMWSKVAPHLSPSAVKSAAETVSVVMDAWSGGSFTGGRSTPMVVAAAELAESRKSPPPPRSLVQSEPEEDRYQVVTAPVTRPGMLRAFGM